MAPLEQHIKDCEKYLGNGFEDVNRWIDQYFGTMGARHRVRLHHREGIDEAYEKFGATGADAAAIHILRDCRHIPAKADYQKGFVDDLGLRKYWPVTAYTRYREEDFDTLASQYLKGSSARILWAFINEHGIDNFLGPLTRLDPAEVEKLRPEWKRAVELRNALLPVKPPQPPTPVLDLKVQAYVEEIRSSPLLTSIAAQYKNVSCGMVRVGDLVNPLVYIDSEYVESLKAELPDLDAVGIAKFALPTATPVNIHMAMDPTRRSVTFISSEKTLTVAPMSVTNSA